MFLLVRLRYKVQIDLLRQLGIPLPGNSRIASEAKKQDRYTRRHGPCGNCAAFTQTSRHAHGERVFRGANGYTLQASGALGRSDLYQSIDRQCRGTSLGALGAINAIACVTHDLRGAEQGDQSKKPAIGAKITAPKVCTKIEPITSPKTTHAAVPLR